MSIRPETIQDKSKIATLIANAYAPEGAKIIEKVSVLRSLDSFEQDLSLVQESDTGIEAFTLFTPIQVGDGKAVFMAPLAFDFSSSGFDLTSFIKQAVEHAKTKGFRYVFVQGSGDELKPFGFDYAADKGFVHHAGNMMVCDLGEGAVLSGEVKLPEVLEN